MSVVALVPVTGRTGQFGEPFLVDSGAPRDAGIFLLEPVLLQPALGNLLASGRVDLVVLVVPSTQVDIAEKAIAEFGEKPIRVIGVEEIAFASTNSIIAHTLPDIAAHVSDISTVLVHALRHAYSPPDLVRQIVDEVEAGAPAVIPVLPCTDTVKELDESGVIIDTPDRATLRVTQSPAGFAARLWRTGPGGWDQLPPGTRTIPGHPAARAIRTAFDLVFAKDSR